MLEPRGLLLLSVPTNAMDDIVFPSHRIYGPKRLAQLLNGWTLHGRVWKGTVVRGGLEVADTPPALFPKRTRFGRLGWGTDAHVVDWQHQPVLALTRD